MTKRAQFRVELLGFCFLFLLVRGAIAAGHPCQDPNDCHASSTCRATGPETYTCECNNGYRDASPKNQLPGSVCVFDYCSDVNFCPANTTCVNGECICLPGMVDIRKSNMKAYFGIDQSTLCLSVIDVNECALGLTKCSSVAICEELKIGYRCSCAEGWIDGNPAEPGQICAAPICMECNQHGQCIYKSQSNMTCACEEGYAGEHCEVVNTNFLKGGIQGIQFFKPF